MTWHVRRGGRGLGLMLLSAPPFLLQGWYIWRYGVNVPWADEWALTPFLQLPLSPTWFGALLIQHNEHRIVFPRLVLYSLARLDGWNVKLELYANLLLLLLCVLLWARLYFRYSRGPWWAWLPVPWLALSLGQWENVVWGWQVAIYLLVLATLTAVTCLAEGGLRQVGLGALAALVASFSFMNGLLLWPVGLVYLLARRAGRRAAALWAGVGTLALFIYFRDFDYRFYPDPARPTSIAIALANPLAALRFWVTAAGAPLAAPSNPNAALGLGALVLLATAGGYAMLLRDRSGRGWRLGEGDLVLGALLLFSFASSGVIALGRSGYWFVPAGESRYTTIALVGIVAAYLMVVRHTLGGEARRGSWRRLTFAVTFVVMTAGVAANTRNGLEVGRGLYAGHLRARYLVQTFERQTDSALGQLFGPVPLLREYAGFIKAKGYGLFREPLDLLLLPEPRGAYRVGELLPARGVRQRLRCPVQTLRDVEIQMATYARVNHATVQVGLYRGDELLAQASWGGRGLGDNGWQPLVLSRPLEHCAGQELVVNLLSEDGREGDALSAWTFPSYYDGELQGPSGELDREHGLALELNGVAYGLEEP